MRLRRVLVVVVALTLLVGCAPDARLLATQQADQLEVDLESTPGISGATATVNDGAIGLQVGVDVTTESDYLDALQRIVDVWSASPLAERKALTLLTSPEGSVAFSNVDPDDLEAVMTAARILWHYGQDDSIDIDSSSGSGLANRQFALHLLVADESQIAPALAHLTAMVDEAGLLYRPDDGLTVEVRRS